MDNFLNLFLETLGVGEDGLNRARGFHARFISRLVILVVGLILIGYIFHRLGLGVFDIGMGIVLDIVSIIVFVRPEPLLVFLGLGAFLGIMKTPETISQETRDVFSWYASACGNFILLSSVVFMFLGTWPWVIGFGHFLVICLSLLTLASMSVMWKKSGKFGKTFAYAYTVLILVVFVFWTSAPDAAKSKIFGPDFPREIVSEQEMILSEIENEQLEQEKAKVAQRLEEIRDKVEDGETLSRGEIIFLEEAREKRDKETIPVRISSLIPEKISEQGGSKKISSPEKEFALSSNACHGVLEISGKGRIEVLADFKNGELLMKSTRRTQIFSAIRAESGWFYGNWKEEGKKGGFRINGNNLEGAIEFSGVYIPCKLVF